MKTKISYLTLSVIFITVLGVFITACKKDDPKPTMVATSMALVSGGGQTATVETALANPVVVIVKDQEGKAFKGATVKFAITEGSVSNATVTTDINGNANVTWTLGPTIGTQTLNATVTGLTGSPVAFTATGGQITVTDYDNNIYNAVIIGNQVWMAENLKVTHYPNGDAIPLETDNTNWGNLADNNTDDAYCFYDNNPGSDYGALYTYAAAIGDNWARDNNAGQGVCPDGWHLPSDAEWTELTDYLGGLSVAGGKLKETGTIHWNSPNTGATNESGFTALPGGYRDGSGGNFGSLGSVGTFWSATENGAASAWGRYLSGSNVDRSYSNKSYGFSVRCLRD